MVDRILTLVHAHISTSFGGSEHAAFALHGAYRNQGEAWILTPRSAGDEQHSDRDLTITTNSNPLTLQCLDPTQRDQQLAPLLEMIKPQIIHLHHYLHFGVDVIDALKQLCPTATVVLTLHEYLLLCALDGQMLKRGSHRLCSNPGPEACVNCFDGVNPSLFEQRQEATQAALDACDGLISPSHWVLQVMQQSFKLPAATRVIENGLPRSLLNACQPNEEQTCPAAPALHRFAFFGRASERKGLLVLLQACHRLTLSHAGQFQLQLHGGGLEQEPAAIQHRIQALIGACGDHVALRGRYQQIQIPQLMQQCDWVIVPSIWWENSPVVIQEAFACGKPVLGSNHGGIAEKINGRGGVGFQPNSAEDLARCMAEAIGNGHLHQDLQEQMAPPFSVEACAAEHLSFYQELMSSHACG